MSRLSPAKQPARLHYIRTDAHDLSGSVPPEMWRLANNSSPVLLQSGVNNSEIQSLHQAQDPLVIPLFGDYDMVSSGSRLAQELEPALTHPIVVLDFSRVTYMDSAGLAQLSRAQKEREQHQLPFAHVAALSPMLAKVFRIVGFDQLWPVHKTVELALDR